MAFCVPCYHLVCIVVVVLCVLLLSYVYLLYYVCIAVFTLDAGLLAISQYPEGPATGHPDTGFSRFPCVYKQMLRWFPRFQVATTCFSCSTPDLNLLVNNFIFMYMHNNHCHRATARWQLNILLLLLLLLLGTAVARWLRCCATNRKVAGSILAGVIEIFH